MELLVSWATSHQQFVEGLAMGWALNHVPLVAGWAFHQALKWPWLRAAILKNPEQAKAIIDQVSKELEKDIDEEAKPDANKPS